MAITMTQDEKKRIESAMVLFSMREHDTVDLYRFKIGELVKSHTNLSVVLWLVLHSMPGRGELPQVGS